MSHWTPVKLEKLRVMYLNNERLKTIAQKLSHSETAVNKALTRYKIRPEMYKGYKNLDHINETETIEKPFMLEEYLKDLMGKSPEKRKGLFFFEDSWITRNQVILRLNQKRAERGLGPIFFD